MKKQEKHFSDGIEVMDTGRHKCSLECITDKKIVPQITKRCSFSREGLDTFGKNRIGKIVGESRDKTCWLVIWEGQNSKQAFHKSFIYVED